MPREKARTTIGDLLLDKSAWWIIGCTNTKCGRRIASNLLPYAVRWGEDASSDKIRDNLVCEVCGHRGVELTHASFGGKHIGWSPFPGEGVEVTPSRLTVVKKAAPLPPKG
jgi:hypothetical protein